MIRDYFDVKSLDREDLAEAAEESFDALRRREAAIRECVRDAFEETTPSLKEVENALDAALGRELGSSLEAVRAAAETFVRGLTLRGWALLPPREVGRIDGLLRGSELVKMRTPRVKPRVKRLREE